jgi:chromatin segregation and condensation protein Rec8/ScpA/Scc1 (kleisin family)
MIGVIGGRRLLVILVMVLVSAAMAAGLYMYLEPKKVELTREYRTIQGKISSREQDIANLQLEREKLLEQKDTFEDLKKLGFFSAQDRIVARERIEEIRELSRVLAVRYTIKPAILETNEEIKKAKHIILSSPFHLEIDALDDIDIYRFIYLLKTSFPGHVSFDKIELRRMQDVTESVLRQIGSGNPVVLVNARIEFTWRTIVPEDQINSGEMQVRGL